MDIIKLGLVYTVEHWQRGRLVDQETTRNLIPLEGLGLMTELLFNPASAPPAAWYVALYKTAYVPTPTVTAATINALAQECVSYTEVSRPEFTGVQTAIGVTDNSADRAEFTFAGNDTIYGGFLTTAPTKGAPTGTLLSVVKFSTVKNVTADSVLRVRAGLSLVSL